MRNYLLLLSIAIQTTIAGSSPPRLVRAEDLSVNNALQILLNEGLYELCALYVNRPLYATTITATVGRTATQTTTVTGSATVTATIRKGTAQTEVVATRTKTASSAYGTDTQYIFDLVTKTSHFTTTLSATTTYTPTSHANIRRAQATFPPPLPSFTRVLSSACSSLLAAHTSTVSRDVATTTITYTAPTVTNTHFTTQPVSTTTLTSNIIITTIVPYLASTTVTTRITVTTTLTATKYLTTVRAPAQCAPSAYVSNADEYVDDGINFTSAPNQSDALGCCRACVEAANCQAWIFYGNPNFSPPGTCVQVTGTAANTCPATVFNQGFYPICLAQDQNQFSVGLGACASNIVLTAGGCELGQNQ